jgi:hypothetical protein
MARGRARHPAAWHRRRNTPASTGRTVTGQQKQSPTPEHSRVGGKDADEDPASPMYIGTPPRRRGEPVHRSRSCGRLRNTPAPAGRTPAARARPDIGTEHPRAGGENTRARPNLVGGRNTPASAGSTPLRPRTQTLWSDHPRVGGEHWRRTASASRSTGTPLRRRGELRNPHRERGEGRNTPRRRGEPCGAFTDDLCLRNTPAPAGRTGPRQANQQTTRRPIPRRTDYEDPSCCRRPLPAAGLSPHRRTGGDAPAFWEVMTRVRVPRHRGRPRTRPEVMRSVQGPTSGTPPRRRGEHPQECPDSLCQRNTPAPAGRTLAHQPPGDPPAEHPRVGGETVKPTTENTRSGGTPPRRRGERGRTKPGCPPGRNTPASAGRTGAPDTATPPAELPRVAERTPCPSCAPAA